MPDDGNDNDDDGQRRQLLVSTCLLCVRHTTGDMTLSHLILIATRRVVRSLLSLSYLPKLKSRECNLPKGTRHSCVRKSPHDHIYSRKRTDEQQLLSQVALLGTPINDKNGLNLDSRTNCLTIWAFNFTQWKESNGHMPVELYVPEEKLGPS